MSAEANKVIARRFFEEFVNTGNNLVADELCAPNYVFYFPGSPGPMDHEGAKQSLAMNRAAFPDWHITIEDMIAEDDKVATRMTLSGTHQGTFQGIPPTSKQVGVSAIVFMRLVEGKIVEDRVEADLLGMLQQLGAIPAPG